LNYYSLILDLKGIAILS